jgi:hypothetical protein
MSKLGRRLTSDKLKAQILLKQYGRCGYCNISLQNENIEWDHFIPWSYLDSSGGEDNWVASCWKCNGKKSSKVFTDISQITKFSFKMIQSHGSFGEGWSEGTESWQEQLNYMASDRMPEKKILRRNRESNSLGS